MTTTIHPVVAETTRKIVERSAESRAAYLTKIRAAAQQGPARGSLGCANFAHGFAASGDDKLELRQAVKPNVAIVSSYNDMLSAHQPFDDFPAQLKASVRDAGGVAQFAGGVPAMCDGITQGRAGMELSLYSRDVIAMASAIALSHEMFDANLMLGVCDKIVPGLVIGALAFGHLPTVLVPAGPMTSGLSNALKSKVRQDYAQGLVGRDELLEAESAAYHGPGTCTFYGTANSNQMLMELMGLHLPGASFVNPNTPLRTALTEAAGRRAVELTAAVGDYTPIGEIVDEKAVVNGVVALLATGGSTNHTMHLVAMARAAGIDLRWDDFAALSAVVPLLARIYPNGKADVNHFHAAGGTAFLVRELLDAGLLHADVRTVAGRGLAAYTKEPTLAGGELSWRDGPIHSLDRDVLRGVDDPFDTDGGLRMLSGNLGRAVIKTSAVAPEHRLIEAPARVFADQADFLAAFEAGELDHDLVAVIRFQGPKANGMPELHKLTPPLGVLQDRGHRVALLTDGRMSGASGKIPAAIHVTPEAAGDGPIGRVRNGDPIRLDADAGRLEVLVDAAEFAARRPAGAPDREFAGTGRELFESFRLAVGPADAGASVFGPAQSGTAQSGTAQPNPAQSDQIPFEVAA
ncbi:MAG TPA: phosphogluconate dehydratase [Pseudonocardia sp.]|nr:phosphogluconate dehydratase [Pseudonocardia sp.]